MLYSGDVSYSCTLCRISDEEPHVYFQCDCQNSAGTPVRTTIDLGQYILFGTLHVFHVYETNFLKDTFISNENGYMLCFGHISEIV
jgi:hypothetical protein